MTDHLHSRAVSSLAVARKDRAAADLRSVCYKRSQWRTSRLTLVRLRSDRLSPEHPVHLRGF